MQFGVTMFPTHDAVDPITLGRAAAAGVTRCLFMLPSAGAETVLPRLRRYAGLAR